jgi:hypothetical protein
LAEQYDLIIANFLRAQAVAHSAKTNYQYLLLAFYADPSPVNQPQLENSTGALNGTKLNPARLTELQIQLRLLLKSFL